MKAEQFIKAHGVEKARDVVEGAPEFVTHVRQTNFGNFIYYKIENGELLVWIPVVDVWSTSTNQDYEVTSLSVLKRLVESVDRINGLSKFAFRGGNALAWARLILKHAPIDTDAYSPITKNYFYSPNIKYDFDLREWIDMDRGIDLDVYQEFIFIKDLDQWIQDYDDIYEGASHE